MIPKFKDWILLIQVFEKKKKKFWELGMEVRESDKNAEVGRKENNSESRIFFWKYTDAYEDI